MKPVRHYAVSGFKDAGYVPKLSDVHWRPDIREAVQMPPHRWSRGVSGIPSDRLEWNAPGQFKHVHADLVSEMSATPEVSALSRV